MTMTDPLTILFISDIHFGCSGNNQEEMADAFGQVFVPFLRDADVVFINGDFFDTQVNFNSHGFDPVYDAIINLFQTCDKHNVTLRILQGTWTHDLGQLKRFVNLYRNHGYSFPFRIIEQIDVEEIHVKDRSLRIVYAPDDLPVDSSEAVLDIIHTKLQEKGWDWVDYGCLHGFFDFTIGAGRASVIYREDQFPFVRKIVDVGHVHQHRVQGKVISNGSFDRDRHGDEEPKGFIKVLDYPDSYSAQFIENKLAGIHNTLALGNVSTTDELRQMITDHLSAIDSPRTISLRFETDSADHVAAIRSFMGEHYPHVKIKFKSPKKKEDDLFEGSALVEVVEQVPAPTPKTIAAFVKSHLSEHSLLTVEKIAVYLDLSP